MVDLLYFVNFSSRVVIIRQWRLHRLDCASEQADPNEDGDHVDAGGLENCAKEGREAFWPQRTPSFCVWGENSLETKKTTPLAAPPMVRVVQFFRRIAPSRRRNQGDLVGLSVSAKRPSSSIMSFFISQLSRIRGIHSPLPPALRKKKSNCF